MMASNPTRLRHPSVDRDEKHAVSRSPKVQSGTTLPHSTKSKVSAFLTSLAEGVRRCHLVGKHVLCAVSGGADSVSLLRGLNEISQAHALRLTVAHLDHGLRTDSSMDAEWVQSLAKHLGIECVLGSSQPRVDQSGIEEWARDERYEFLTHTAERIKADTVALAHTADDQAETILHHVVRGTGLPGLSGMPWVRALSKSVALARPMLHITRESVTAHLQRLGQDFRTDSTNRDLKFTRNRIRLELLPALRESFNQNVTEALCSLGEQAHEVTAWMDELAHELLGASIVDSTVHERDAETCRVNCDALSAVPDVMLRHVLLCLWKKLAWPRKRMRSTDWARLADVVRGAAAENLPGNIDARKRGNLLVLRRQAR